MNSTTEPHADRTEQPILSENDTYKPKRSRWPGLLAVAVLVAAAAGGMVVTAQQDAKQASSSPDRGAQTSAAQQTPATPSDDAKVAQRARPDRPGQH
jgi:hypothetical protein